MAQTFQSASTLYLKHLFPIMRITRQLETGAVTDLLTGLTYTEVLALMEYDTLEEDAIITVNDAVLHVRTAAGSVVTADIGIANIGTDTDNTFFNDADLNTTGTVYTTVTRARNLGPDQHLVAKASTDVGANLDARVDFDFTLMRRRRF